MQLDRTIRSEQQRKTRIAARLTCVFKNRGKTYPLYSESSDSSLSVTSGKAF